MVGVPILERAADDSRSVIEIRTDQSVYSRYYLQRGVRKSRRHTITEADEGKYFFPRTLFPVVEHPRVQAMGDDVVRAILAARLMMYLLFTRQLETQAINPVCLHIAGGEAGIKLTEIMQHDFFLVYEDEAHHAVDANDILLLAKSAAGHTVHVPTTPAFLKKLHRAKRNLSEPEQQLLDITYAICSETLVSGILTHPADPTVVTAVSEHIDEHRRDEAVHKHLFETFAEQFYPKLPREYRQFVGEFAPQAIRWFLEPDMDALQEVLAQFSLTRTEVERILKDAYPVQQVEASIRQAAKHSIALFQRLGALEDPFVEAAFARNGLL